MDENSISLCMIAKNAGKCLNSCLDSVKGIVDEIIVVDTGSTDGTKDIAKEYNAKIVDFKWNDDFSRARNESLKHATKDWILILDADEELDTEGRSKIKELAKQDKDAYFLVQKNYSANTNVLGFVNSPYKKDSNTYPGWYASLIVRLFRNHKGIEFIGTVHESVEPSLEKKGIRIANSNVAIHHFGNVDAEAVKKKKQFYLELCKRKVIEIPDSDSYLKLGVLYKENRDFDNAAAALKKSVELDNNNGLAHFELGAIYEKNKAYDDAISQYNESLKIKKSSEAYYGLGVCFLKKGMLKEAKNSLTKALILNPKKIATYNSLGAVQEKIGDFTDAVKTLQAGIRLSPSNSTGYYNLGIVYDKMNNFPKALRCFEKAIQLGHKNKDKINERVSQLRELNTDTSTFTFGFEFGKD